MRNETPGALKSILVADDNSDVRQILRAIFARAGYSVTEARGGLEALDLLETRHFDLMVLDLMMPQVSGEQVLHQLGSERLKEMPVIVLTAKDLDPNIMKGGMENPLFYVVKPFHNALIRDLARYLMEDLTAQEQQKVLLHLLQCPSLAAVLHPRHGEVHRGPISSALDEPV